MKAVKESKTKTWKYEKAGVDGNATLFGVNIFDYEWKGTNRTVKVRDPLYGNEYVFSIYTVTIKGMEQEFAAGEFSNCVWGFYLPEY